MTVIATPFDSPLSKSDYICSIISGCISATAAPAEVRLVICVDHSTSVHLNLFDDVSFKFKEAFQSIVVEALSHVVSGESILIVWHLVPSLK